VSIIEFNIVCQGEERDFDMKGATSVSANPVAIRKLSRENHSPYASLYVPVGALSSFPKVVSYLLNCTSQVVAEFVAKLMLLLSILLSLFSDLAGKPDSIRALLQWSRESHLHCGTNTVSLNMAVLSC
jgi:hypothetical protein